MDDLEELASAAGQALQALLLDRHATAEVFLGYLSLSDLSRMAVTLGELLARVNELHQLRVEAAAREQLNTE